MKIIFTLTFLFILGINFSQLSECNHSFHFKMSLGKVDSASYQNFSIGGEWMIKKRFGLNYNFDFVHRNDQIYQLHSSAGLIAGPPLIGLGIISSIGKTVSSGNGDADLGALGVIGGILLLILPEGVSYHIPYRYNWDFAPYLNVLGVDFMKNNKPNVNKGYLRYAATAGLKVSYWNPKNYTFFSFIETRKTAGMGFAYGGGFGIGITFE